MKLLLFFLLTISMVSLVSSIVFCRKSIVSFLVRPLHHSMILPNRYSIGSIDPSTEYIAQPLNCPTVLEANSFFKSKQIDFIVHLSKTKQWRSVSKIAVRGTVSRTSNNDVRVLTRFGLFKPGTHDVIDISEYESHHPNINRVIELIKNACVAVNVNGYVEGTGTEASDYSDFHPFLKYLMIGVERSTGKIQLSVVWNTEPEGANKVGDLCLDSLVSKVLKVSGNGAGDSSNPLFHSIWVNYNPSEAHVNRIAGRGTDSWRLLYGPEHVVETVIAFPDNKSDAVKAITPRLRFPPFVFRQANLDAFSRIILSIRSWIPSTLSVQRASSGKRSKESSLVRCVELYGGVGTIGLNCLDLFSHLSCSDENPHNKACFELTLADMKQQQKELTSENHSIHLGKAVYDPRSASAVVVSGGLKGFDLVVVDPPRKGLDEEVIHALLDPTTGNRRLIYVSCGFKSFKRDCALLTGETLVAGSTKSGQVNRIRNGGKGQWSLVHAEGHVLCPGADHIETLAIFDRTV